MTWVRDAWCPCGWYGSVSDLDPCPQCGTYGWVSRHHDSGRRIGWRRYVFEEHDRLVCFWCHVALTLPMATIEHLVPRSEGGPDEQWNWRLACENCNTTRNGRPAGVWASATARNYILRKKSGNSLDRSSRVITINDR